MVQVPQNKLNLQLPHDPAIPLLGTYSEELKAGSQRGVCAPTSTAALFMAAKRWKPPKCPSTGKQIGQTWPFLIVEGYSPLRSKE